MGIFMVNSYVVWDEESKDGMIIDPGEDFGRIVEMIESEGIAPRFIALTHGHYDHVESVQEMKEKYGVPLFAHPEAQQALNGLPEQAALFNLSWNKAIPAVDNVLREGETISAGKTAFRVLFTPGHSVCGVTFAGDGTAFVGDLIFRNSVGRTDFKGGSREELLHSIHKKIFTLPPGTRLLSGHGPETTVEHEMTENPFV